MSVSSLYNRTPPPGVACTVSASPLFPWPWVNASSRLRTRVGSRLSRPDLPAASDSLLQIVSRPKIPEADSGLRLPPCSLYRLNRLRGHEPLPPSRPGRTDTVASSLFTRAIPVPRANPGRFPFISPGEPPSPPLRPHSAPNDSHPPLPYRLLHKRPACFRPVSSASSSPRDPFNTARATPLLSSPQCSWLSESHTSPCTPWPPISYTCLLSPFCPAPFLQLAKHVLSHGSHTLFRLHLSPALPSLARSLTSSGLLKSHPREALPFHCEIAACPPPPHPSLLLCPLQPGLICPHSTDRYQLRLAWSSSPPHQKINSRQAVVFR